MKIPFLFFYSLIIFFVCQQKANGQYKVKEIGIQQSIQHQTDSIFNKLVHIRRDFHENPELAGKEIRTQQKIVQYLLDLGLEVDTSIYGHGVVGILKGGKKGKIIAWRAEMDALPNSFPDDVDFNSTVKGIQHGCGHDVHMAIALGIAEVLVKHKASLNGTVCFIFQPEEESFIGAKAMIAGGLLAKIKPVEMYGLHVSALPVGQIMVKPNELFAYQKRIRITLKNELTNEQVKVLCQNIYQQLSRAKTGAKPWELPYINDFQIGLANPNSIFKDYLIMDEHFAIRVKNKELLLEAYLYETNQANIKNIIPAITRIIAASNYTTQLLSVSFTQQNPTVINDEKLTRIAVKTLDAIYGKGFVVTDYGQVPYFNDDFAFFQQKIPGVFFLFGGSNINKGIIAMNHASNFRVDEACIKFGVNSFSSLILGRLKAN